MYVCRRLHLMFIGRVNISVHTLRSVRARLLSV